MLQKIITILFLSGDPLNITIIAAILGVTQQEVESHIEEVENALYSIGLSLMKYNNEISIVTNPDQAALVKTFWEEELKGDVSPAALQVLTLVAYLGKPTREQISYIRGVQSSQSIRTLSVRGLITRNGEVCTLTPESLKHLGVTKIEDLPEYESISKSLNEKLATREA